MSIVLGVVVVLAAGVAGNTSSDSWVWKAALAVVVVGTYVAGYRNGRREGD